MVFGFLLKKPRCAIILSQRHAEHLHALLRKWDVVVSPSHNGVWIVHLCLLGQPIDSRGRHSTSVPDLGSPLWMSMLACPQAPGYDLIHNFHPLWMTHQRDVIQECQHPFGSEQPV